MTDTDKQQVGIVYFIQPAELVGTDRYKVGYSKSPTLKRLSSYKKGTRVISVNVCKNPYDTEQKILKEFNNKFTLFAGNEYFSGNELEMLETYINVLLASRKYYDDDNNLKQNHVLPLKDANYNCNKCEATFTRKDKLDYHIENNSCSVKRYFCKYCKSGFTQKNSMYRHMKHTCKYNKSIVMTNITLCKNKRKVAHRNGKHRKSN